MTATLDDVTKKADPTAEEQAAGELVRRAREAGPVPDRPGRAAQAADQDGARNRAEPGDDRAVGGAAGKGWPQVAHDGF